jgi:hypothetical protein
LPPAATPHGSEYGDTPGARLFNNCVYAYCLDAFTQAAAILGKPEDVTTYSGRLALLVPEPHGISGLRLLSEFRRDDLVRVLENRR